MLQVILPFKSEITVGDRSSVRLILSLAKEILLESDFIGYKLLHIDSKIGAQKTNKLLFTSTNKMSLFAALATSVNILV